MGESICSDKIKILYVCTVPTAKSGIPNVIFNLLDGFDKSGMDLGYVSINEPSEYYKGQLRNLGVELFVVPRKLVSPLSYIRQLSRIAEGYDIMHVHGNSATMVLEMIAAKLGGVKLRIAHSHNTSCKMKLIDTLMRPLFYKLCNIRMACGTEAGKWLYGKRDFIVLNNGIDSDRYKYNTHIRHKIRQNLKIDNKIIIGNIGNFVEQKNHRFLIDIFKEIAKIQPDAILLLLGTGPLQTEIETRAKNYGISDKIIFAGSVDNPHDFMSAMDIIVMPSLFEGFPLTLVEEQANGLSILASDSITKDTNLTGNVHFISLFDTPEKWAQKALNILENSIHSETVSKKSIDLIRGEGYDIINIASDLKNLYKSHFINLT